PVSSSLFPYTTLFRSEFVAQFAPILTRELPRGRKAEPAPAARGALAVEGVEAVLQRRGGQSRPAVLDHEADVFFVADGGKRLLRDRKSTRLNSSHVAI